MLHPCLHATASSSSLQSGPSARDSVLWGGFSNCHAYLIFILTFSPFSAALDPVDRPILYKPLVAHLLLFL
ncbi:unnamed protein product [Gulo gulo]|uniref:Uncharacterized protein n=1 Tax=Gulo gulo TaxID=48420 RepID=A0A9X9LRE5_GULGU|nr:unnamed protein product [Gulo gulo]